MLRLTQPGTPDPLLLPPEIAVSRIGILATSGAGKSNAAVALAEEMYDAGIPWVAVDPKGDWFGVRSNHAGDGPGLPIPILGGLHGDVPLEPSSGKLVANLIADRGLTCVLDVSEFDSLQAMWRFLTEFAQTLLRRNTKPLHIFAEEASDYLPQSSREGGYLPKAVNAWRRLVAQGRNHGIGVTLISQRSAKLDKEALDLIETLIAMRATSPRDLKAVGAWVEGHDIARELVQSLPSLADGEAWVWSPYRLKMSRKVLIRRRRTFDSGATPLVTDAAARKAATLADVDLDALKAEMAETVERAERDDPARLRQEIADLERALIDAERAADARIVEQHVVEVPVVPAGFVDALSEIHRHLQSAVQEHKAAVHDEMDRFASSLTAVWNEVRDLRDSTGTVPQEYARPDLAEPMLPPRGAPQVRQGAVRGGIDYKRTESLSEAVVVSGAPAKVLAALRSHPREGITRSRIAALTGISSRRSTLRNALSTLRTRGLIEDLDGYVSLTPAGAVAAGGVEPLPTGGDLADHWRRHAGTGAPGKILDALLDRPDDWFGRVALAEASGISSETSTLRNALSRLRTLGLLEEDGDGIRLDRDLRRAIG